jgi:outer membrane receptor protein involved in Fe transport
VPAIVAALAVLCPGAHAQQAPSGEAMPASNELPAVEVVAPAPLPGLGVDLRQVPANVQTIDARRLEKDHPVDASEAIERHLGSVNLNDTQGGPLQADVNFRGFTASPILGTPEGISVFVDGVRVNEAFGDTVNWDLVPPSAIARITVIPGSNPVFGLNTLGGALAVATKSGFEYPGTTASVSDGSWGRETLDVASGGHGERVEYFVAGRVTNDDGWAEHNPSRIRQLFSKLGYQTGATDVDASLTYADDTAQGNQTIPLSFLGDPRQVYSYPDVQQNRMWFGNLQLSQSLGERQVLAADLYDRAVRSSVFNSNVNNSYDPNLPLAPGNYPGGNAINGIDQERAGFSLQYNGIQDLGGHRNNLTVGAAVDHGTTDFTQFNQDAPILADRGTFSTLPILLAIDLHAIDDNAGAYATDLLELAPAISLTMAARYNRASERLQDRLGNALDGEHSFGRLNPAVGLNYSPSEALTTYASFNEGMRVPTPVELTCANPAAPCSLPNAFSSDPALRPVVSRTWELGARGSLARDLNWSSALFRSTLDDDIEFISSGGGATSAGYFRNVGQTRRQGLELGLAASTHPIDWRLEYTWLQATFRTPLLMDSPDNSSARPLGCAACTDILVQPGDRLPGIPSRIVKLDFDWSANERASLDLNLVAQSSTYPRGDENNLDRNGTVPGFALANLGGRYKLTDRLELFAKIDNLFDREISSFGILGANAFHLPGNAFDPNPASWPATQFRSIGSGRGAWLGLSYHLPP